MTNPLSEVQKNLRGFASKSACGPTCDNTRLVCLEIANKNYLLEVDSCGNPVTDPKPMGTCSVMPNGVPFPQDENGNQIIDINEIDMDINDVILNGSVINFVSEDGTQTPVDICALVAANCNSPMTLNADGSVTYMDNAGVVTTIPAPVPETVTTFVINADGSATYTSEDGTVTSTPAPTVSALVAAGSVITHTSGDGTAVSFDICAIVAANCNSPMVVNADGSVTYTDNAGAVTTIPAPVTDTLVVNADGSVTHTAVDGTVEVIPAPVVSALAVAGSAVTHTDGNGLAVTFDICAIVAANCNSPMVLNADGSVTYTDNAGAVTTIPAPVNSSLVADVAAGTFTHTTGDGVDTVVDVCALAQICAPSLVAGPGVNEYTFDNGYGVTQVINVNEIDMDINSMTITGSVVNFSSEDGTAGSFDICAIVAANCNSPMTLNADGSVSYTDNAGVLTVIPAPIVTTFVINADGSATYTSEDGTVTTTPAPNTSSFTSNGDGTTTHSDGAGNDTSNIQEDIVDGGSNLVAADGVTINPLLDCNAAPIDVTAAANQFMLYNQLAALNVGFPLCNHDFGADGCSPIQPDPKLIALGFQCFTACSPRGDLWEWSAGSWALKVAKYRRWKEGEQVLTPALNEDQLAGNAQIVVANNSATPLPDITMTNQFQTIGRVCIDIENDDCDGVEWEASFDARWAFVGSLSGGNYIQAQVIGSETLPAATFNGTVPLRKNVRCNATNCLETFGVSFNADARRLYTIAAGETRTFCLDVQARMSVYSASPNGTNTLDRGTFAINAEITRQCV